MHVDPTNGQLCGAGAVAGACLPAVEVERVPLVVVVQSIVEADDEGRPRVLRVAAQRDAVAPRHERVATVADLDAAAQHGDARPICGRLERRQVR